MIHDSALGTAHPKGVVNPMQSRDGLLTCFSHVMLGKAYTKVLGAANIHLHSWKVDISLKQ